MNALDEICTYAQRILSGTTLTFALVAWVKGDHDNPQSLALAAHPDFQGVATRALRTVADADDRQKGLAVADVALLQAEIHFWREHAALWIAAARQQVEDPAFLATQVALGFGLATPEGRLSELSTALRGAMDGDLWPRCEGCGKPVKAGHSVVQYDDAGEVHADCDHPLSPPPGTQIPIDADEVIVEEGQAPPAPGTAHLTVYAAANLFTTEQILDRLTAAEAALAGRENGA